MNNLSFDNPFPVVSAAAMVIAVGVASSYFHQQSGSSNYKGRKTLPYAPDASILETATQLSAYKSPQFVEELFRRVRKMYGVGSFRLNVPTLTPGGPGLYVIGDAGLARQILQEPKAVKGDFYTIFGGLGSTKENIFSAETSSPHWHFARKTLRHAFSNKEVSRMTNIAKEVADNWMNGKREDGGAVFDPSEEMVKLTFRVICKAAFEYDCSDEEFHTFGADLKAALPEMEAARLFPVREYFWFLFPKARDAYASCKSLQDFGKRVLDNYRSMAKEERSKSNTLIKIINENEGFGTDEQRVAEIVIFMIAGHDTTGYTLGSTLVLLAEHPEIAQKLREELSNLVPEEWKSCAYLKWTIKESMRIMPVAALGSTRVTTKDYNVGKDWVLPKGSTTFLVQILPYHDAEIFESPEDFVPTRWANPTEAKKQSFVPFSMGARNCVGQSLATSELESVLPAIIQEFDLELVDKGDTANFLTMKFAGAKLKLHRRSS